MTDTTHRKPFYKKWWGICLVVLGVLVLALAVAIVIELLTPPRVIVCYFGSRSNDTAATPRTSVKADTTTLGAIYIVARNYLWVAEGDTDIAFPAFNTSRVFCDSSGDCPLDSRLLSIQVFHGEASVFAEYKSRQRFQGSRDRGCRVTLRTDGSHWLVHQATYRRGPMPRSSM